jgi:hypothetical protein
MGNRTIRQIAIATGAVTTLAGSAGATGSADGKGPDARFNFLAHMAGDNAGNLFVADQYIGMGCGGTVRKITISTGVVTTVVGSPGRFGTVPGPLPAQLSKPSGLAFVSPAQLFMTDVGENVVLLAQF